MKLKKIALLLGSNAILFSGYHVHSQTNQANNSAITESGPYACQNNSAAIDELIIYQIMVESFVNGDPNIGHGTGYGTSHHMGDIKGIIDSLDYIQSLGVNAIWMTPIFDSQPIEGQKHWADRLDATGYFATDYFNIDPRFGTFEQAKQLVEEAHKRGLYVFFDGVFGHHKKNVVASPSGNLPVGESNPVSYPDSLIFYKEVAQYWINELKIDGWRLDQAYQVPPEAWTEIRRAVEQASASVTYTNSNGKKVNPLGYMVAEIWAGENRIIETGYGDEDAPALCSAFDFPMRYRLVETFAANEAGVSHASGQWLAEGMQLHDLYPSHAKPNLMIGNHDLVRFGDLMQRSNIASPQDEEYWLRYKAAFAFQTAYSGPITVYYGDEIGDQVDGFANKVWGNCAIQGFCDDHVARTSAKIDGVTASLSEQQAKLKQEVTLLMSLRDKHPALAKGKRTHILSTDQFYVDHKQFGDENLLYVANISGDSQMLSLKGEEIGSKDGLTDLRRETLIRNKQGSYAVDLKPFEARFLKIEHATKPKPQSQSIQTMGDDLGALGKCDNPTVDQQGPVSTELFVVGDFADSGWKHIDSRSFKYKGNNLYQVVMNEKAGSYRMQYAAESWSPQFTADGLSLKLGQTNKLVRGGYGQDTTATLMEDGQYVWSLTFNEDGKAESVAVAKCE
nr:alpha-amylase family glycosyl hydrolase [Vibrio maerlii]